MKEILYVKFSNERKKYFRIKTSVIKENGVKYVEKTPADNAAKEHILSIYQNYGKLVKVYKSEKIRVIKCTTHENAIRFDYIDGKSFDVLLDEIIFEKNDTEKAINEIVSYFDAINNIENCKKVKAGDDFAKVFGKAVNTEEYLCAEPCNIDAAFSNVIINDGIYNIFDYEWVFDFPVPIKYIEYRVILNYVLDNPLRGILVDCGIFERLNINDRDIELFDIMEKGFQSYVYGNSLSLRAYYDSLKINNFNSVEAAEKYGAEQFKNVVDVFFDYGQGVVPESVISLYDAVKDDCGFIQVNTEEISDIRAVRIDPITDYCILTDVVIESVCKNQAEVTAPEFGTNGLKLNDDTYIFADPDVQFYIAADKDTKLVRMSCKIIRLSESTAKALYSRAEEHNRSVAALNEELAEKIGIVSEQHAVIIERDKTIGDIENKLSLREAEIQRLNNTVSENSVKIEKLDRLISNQGSQIEGLNAVIMSKERQIEEIYNSTCWKITAPLRYTVTGTKSFLRNNRVTGKSYEFLYFVKELGLKGAIEHYKKPAFKAVDNNKARENATAVDINSIQPTENFNKKIAVHLHLYYVDLLDEFFSYFNNIPYRFDLFVSCREDSDLNAIRKRFKALKNVNKVEVQKTINRGRDIAPLYVQFGNEIKNYDYFMHVHSKKSVYSGKEQYGWRQHSMDCLLKDRETVKRIFALFENENIGLFYPETFGDMPIIAQDWLENAAIGRQLLNRLGIEFEDGFFNYPVGSFFWARVDALRPLFELRLKYEDFPPEAGQTDGTMAHALERAVEFVAKSCGYRDAIYDVSSGVVALGASYKAYHSYFNTNVDNVKQYLSGFDVISFDIFDTLITRAIYQPDDIFELMQTKIQRDMGITCNYLQMRKKAEALAWENKKEYTSIDDIYEQLQKLMNVSEQEAQRLKNMEIELEYKLCLPRKDMLAVFNYLKGIGKKLVLVSDMYLTADIIADMLKKCGYEGYADLWVSCEKGKRKDSSSMWDSFFDLYGGVKTVHVGDNPQSDIQRVIDRHREALFVINPRTAFKMSKYYDDFKGYINSGIINSIFMGMFINGGIYNSPFCQKLDGEPEITGYDTMGYSAFGPLFSVFSLWLNDVTDKEDVLMFLAREGYIFEKIYNSVNSAEDCPKRKTVYFLSSRRSASVAAIRSEDEIRSIIAQYYRGSISNLLMSRLGLDLYSDIKDENVSMPEQLDYVMDYLKPHLEDIYSRAEEERKAYKSYIEELGLKDGGVVVDVGYSGTIQYYLAKLRQIKQKGAYLSTSTNRKPEQLGCVCSSLYPIRDVSEEKTNKIFKNQLFLEAVLKAPFGQLIQFRLENGKAIPVYKEDSEIPKELKELQLGILNFAEDFGDIWGELVSYVKLNTNNNPAADMFDICLKGAWISQKVAGIMTVQDDYCENGSHQFNPSSGEWEIIKQ